MSGLDVRAFTVGPVQENTYIVRANAEATRAVIVDPGEEAERLLDAAKALGVEIEAILITHCHFDHIGAVTPVARATGAPVYCPEIERPVLADVMSWVPPGFGPFESYDADHTVSGGERLSLAGLDIEVLFTPGHSPGHVTYAIAVSEGDAGAAGERVREDDGERAAREDLREERERALLSGDVLFQGSVGRVDLPGGDWPTLERSIGTLLKAFPAETMVYPGHMGTTTLGRERDTNPFLQELRVAVSKPAAGAEPDLAARAVPDVAAGS
jgi:glyoxylase-like metal-dependent hydrolase (beta-lactamase superfamily II)